MATLRIAAADVDAIARGDRGRLRIGLMQSVGTRILPALLTGFASERPGVEIELHEAHDPGDLLTMVEDQDLDIAFSGELEPTGPFITRHVLDDPFVLLVPNTPEWRERRSISIDDIAAHPLVGNRNPSCAAETLLAFGDRDPTFVFQSDDNTTIQGCVAAGLGVSLAPLLTIDLDDPTTTIVEVEPGIPPRRLAVSWHSGRHPSPLLGAFVDAVVVVCDRIAAEWADERAA